MTTNKLRRRAMPCVLVLCGVATGLLLSPLTAKESYPPVEVLLSTSQTVIGEPIVYPAEPPKVTAVIVNMKPGQETGWHRHNAPLFGYILEGEVTVDYGEHGTKIYRTGDSLVEALGSYHNGRNSGGAMTRILAVFAGGEGVANTTPRAD